MKFIADSMLGRLAKWLRLLGFDTLYYPQIEDSLLLRIAREQDRVILTRNTRLIKVRDISEYMLLQDNDSFRQLLRVIQEYNLIPQSGEISLPSPGRCSICNEPLKKIAKEKAQSHVPEYTYKTINNFKHCEKCGRYYWKGTHQDNLLMKLSELLRHS